MPTVFQGQKLLGRSYSSHLLVSNLPCTKLIIFMKSWEVNRDASPRLKIKVLYTYIYIDKFQSVIGA